MEKMNKKGLLGIGTILTGLLGVGAVAAIIMFFESFKFQLIAIGILFMVGAFWVLASGEVTKRRVGVFLLIILVGGGMVFIAQTPLVEQSILVQDESGNGAYIEGNIGEQILDFCSTEDQCISELKKQGMPDGFLEKEDINISCSNGICKAN